MVGWVFNVPRGAVFVRSKLLKCGFSDEMYPMTHEGRWSVLLVGGVGALVVWGYDCGLAMPAMPMPPRPTPRACLANWTANQNLPVVGARVRLAGARRDVVLAV